MDKSVLMQRAPINSVCYLCYVPRTNTPRSQGNMVRVMGVKEACRVRVTMMSLVLGVARARMQVVATQTWCDRQGALPITGADTGIGRATATVQKRFPQRHTLSHWQMIKLAGPSSSSSSSLSPDCSSWLFSSSPTCVIAHARGKAGQGGGGLSEMYHMGSKVSGAHNCTGLQLLPTQMTTTHDVRQCCGTKLT